MNWYVPKAARSAGLAYTIAMFSLFLPGCGKSGTIDTAMDQQLKDLHAQRLPVGKFAGKVTIDGKPPSEATPKQSVVVVLYDPKNAASAKDPARAFCSPDGNFKFGTYSQDDGVPVGSYIALFAELKGGGMFGKGRGFHGPDGLQNRYNDPDANAENPKFKVDITEPGRTDWVFDLELAGKPPIANPGPKAITQIGPGPRK